MTPRAAILLESREQLARWVERYDLQCEFAELGLDYVFHDQRELDHLAAELQPLAEVGVAGEVIDGPAYLRDEPALREGGVGVVRFPGDARLRPDRYVAELARAVREAGGRTEEHCEVRAMADRAEERRVGRECVRRWRSR